MRPRLLTYPAVGLGIAAAAILGVAFSNWVGSYDAAYYPAVEVGKPTPVSATFIETGWLLAIALALSVSSVALVVLQMMLQRKRLGHTAGGLLLSLVTSLSIGIAVSVSLASSWFLGLLAAAGALCALPLFLSSEETPPGPIHTSGSSPQETATNGD